jgi:hypothetical protein
MTDGVRAKATVITAYSLVFAFAGFLLFYQLDNRLLWGDEAETALLAKNVLRFGIPKTVDGINHITVLGNFRDENAAHIWTWAPWLQEYIVAGSYITFGPTTWASRVPFGAIAWLAVVLLAYFVYQIYRDHRMALASALLLGTPEVFLLHARQCRYYAITVFAEVLLIYGVHELLANRKRGVWCFTLALILQFYTNYIIAAANLGVVIPLGWFLFKQRKGGVKFVALALGLFLCAAAPWLIYAQPWHQSKELIHEELGPKAWYYLTEWHFHFVPWIFLLLPAIGAVAMAMNRRNPNRSDAITPFELSLLILFAGYIVVLLLPLTELRYLLPLLPVGCVLCAVWTFRYIRLSILAVAVIVAQLISNVFAVATSFRPSQEHSWRLPLIDYVRGISGPYTNRFVDVLDFFSREAHAGQSVWVADPEFSLIFYTGLKVIDARLRVPDTLPDWILPQSAGGVLIQSPLALPETVKPYYQAIIIRVHDSDQIDSVPEPDTYRYRTTEKRTDFIIYKKKT